MTRPRELRVGLSSADYVGYAPLFRAIESGAFERRGLAVHPVPYNGGGHNQIGFEAGEIDITHVNPSNLVLSRMKGVDQIGFGGLGVRPDGWQLLSTSSGPNAVSALAGGRIGASAIGSSSSVYAHWVARQVTPVATVEHVGAARLLPSLLDGRVHAIALWPPLSLQAVADRKARSILDLAVALEPSVPAVWAASRRLLREQADDVREFLDGFAEAVRELQDDPPMSANYIRRSAGDLSEAVVDALRCQLLARLRPDCGVPRAALRAALECARVAGSIPAVPEVLEEVFTWEFTGSAEEARFDLPARAGT